jgi:hypothetical protein
MVAGSLKRFPRVSPEEDLHFRHWNIPKGVSGVARLRSQTTFLATTCGTCNANRDYTDSSIHDSLLDAYGPRNIPESCHFQSIPLAV